MMDSVNTPRPTTRTLAVIDGGLNVKARFHPLPSTGKPKLLEQVRQAIRKRHYSDRTEKAYVHWIKRFIFFHNKRHPIEMGEAEIGQFFIKSGNRRASQRIDAKSGVECIVVSLQRGSE